MLKTDAFVGPRIIAAFLLTSALVGCSDEKRPIATAEGTIKYLGKAVPTGSKLIFDDRVHGVTMAFDVDSDGRFSVPESAKLPPGTYAVAVIPPAEYEKVMSGAKVDPIAKPAGKRKNGVPPKSHDPTTNGKSDHDAGGKLPQNNRDSDPPESAHRKTSNKHAVESTGHPNTNDGYPVPLRFRDPKTSGKSVELKKGSQKIEIDLDK